MTIHISGSFSNVDAKIVQAKDGKAEICDKNNFRCFDFKGKEVQLHGKDKLSIYLYNKAIDAGADGKKVKMPEDEK